MVKKIFFVFGLVLGLQQISGCVDCNCKPIKDIYFTKKGMSLKNMDLKLSEPSISKDSIFSSVDYGIQIQFLTEQTVAIARRLNLGLMSTAMACSCEEDNFIAQEKILSLEVFSDNDFDATHPKNTDLSLYFKAKKYKSFIALSDYIGDSGASAMFGFYEGIFLQVAPTLGKKHKFRIKAVLSDGRSLVAQTGEVELR